MREAFGDCNNNHELCVKHLAIATTNMSCQKEEETG